MVSEVPFLVIWAIERYWSDFKGKHKRWSWYSFDRKQLNQLQFLQATFRHRHIFNYRVILSSTGSSGNRFGGLTSLLLNQQNDEKRVAAFITCIGQKALSIHIGLPFQTPNEKKDMAKIIELCESYCLVKTNIIYERYVFNKNNQQEGETVETYASHLEIVGRSG